MELNIVIHYYKLKEAVERLYLTLHGWQNVPKNFSEKYILNECFIMYLIISVYYCQSFSCGDSWHSKINLPVTGHLFRKIEANMLKRLSLTFIDCHGKNVATESCCLLSLNGHLDSFGDIIIHGSVTLWPTYLPNMISARTDHYPRWVTLI